MDEDRLLAVGSQASYPISTLREMVGAGVAEPMGVQYYVDGNVSATGDGSLNYPYSTLAEAIAASHAEIALSANRHWARRNTIWVCGDWLVEDLVAFPQKTDIIGCGSCDGYKGAGITGNHAPVGSCYGTRFYNIVFRPTAAADIVTLTSATGGCEFRGCEFQSHGTLVGVSAIDTTASTWLKIIGCDFMGAFTGDVIDIGAGGVEGTRIVGNNIIGGANDGIVVTGATTAGGSRLGLIANNNIYVVACTINDGDDDTFIITGNNLVSDAATGSASLNVDTRFCANNWITDADKAGPWPRLDDA